MRSLIPCALWTLVLGLPIACGTAKNGTSTSNDPNNADFGVDSPGSASIDKAGPFRFPGSGTSGAAQPLVSALAPESSTQCDPEPTSTLPTTTSEVQTVCFYSEEEPDVPSAAIEQVVEVVGNDEWVHLRLTLNPDFVDNTYGDTAIGWGDSDADEPADPGADPPPGDAPAPPDPGTDQQPPPGDGPASADAGPPPPPANAPAPPDAGAPPPPDGADRPAPPGAVDPGNAPPRDPPARGEARPRRGKAGHTFKDLVGSDHAEIQLLDADGIVSMHFKIDYISATDAAASGYASLGVSGGEGALIVGEPEWVLGVTTSLERNLEACGLSSFTENSPATDEAYTPNPDAADWDYRVSYEIWVSTEAFADTGFGSALIENVHASPSKLASNTVDVKPAPCPVDPANPEAAVQPLPSVLEAIR